MPTAGLLGKGQELPTDRQLYEQPRMLMHEFSNKGWYLLILDQAECEENENDWGCTRKSTNEPEYG